MSLSLEYSLNNLKIWERFEFGRLGKPHFKREGINKTHPKSGSFPAHSLHMLEPLRVPLTPGGLGYSLNFMGPIKVWKINQILTSIYKMIK